MGLYVQESFVNASEGYRFGDSDIYESYCDTTGELFRFGQKEYGKCISKVYVDNINGEQLDEPVHVGWVFQRNEEYEDTHEKYLREVWVTVYDEPDTVVRTHHYHVMGTN